LDGKIILSGAPANAGTNSVGVQSEGEAEGGCGGNSASPEPKRSPAALPEALRAGSSKNIFFSLIEKIFRGRAKSKIVRKMFLLGLRALASGGGAERQFRSKWVRAFSNKGHHVSNCAIMQDIWNQSSIFRSAERI
jgi:hypothetical protein